MDAIAIVVENGDPQEAQHRGRLDIPALINRKTGSQLMQQREGATIVRSSALDFLWRIFTRVAEYITRIRRFFVKDGIPQVKEERGVRYEIKVEDASGACEPPELAEIIVSEKEPTTHAESKTVELLHHNDCGSKQITKEHEQSGTYDGNNPTLHAACAPPSEQPTREPYLQKPANSATCETFPPEHCTATDVQLDECHSQEQDASREEELVRDDLIHNKCLTIEAPSPLRDAACDSKLDTSVEQSALELPPKQMTSSKSVNPKFSIHHLNAIVAEQLTKYVQALERSMVPATLNQNTTHRRAIILATLVAVAIWARNSKHLHEAMPCIRGSTINVHIRSRL